MYSIGQVEDLTGVKAHILRYWEEAIPGFIPQKDDGGRRIYSHKEVELIFRLKYLIYEKKYTLEGAGQQIIREASIVQNNSTLIQQIHETRNLLTDLYLQVKFFLFYFET